MPRNIAGPSLASMLASETPDAYIALLTIKHETATVRFTSDSVTNAVGNYWYIPHPFAVVLPRMEEGRISEGSINITNVDRQLIEEIRGQVTPMTIQIDVMRSVDLNIVASFPEFTMRNVSYNAAEISATITMENFLSEPMPKDTMGGKYFPGLFWR